MSGAEREDAERKRLALVLVELVLSLEQDSFVLQELKSYSPEQLLFLSTDRAPTTLKRHLSGWRRWAEFFRRCCDIPLGAPGCKSLLDFLEALAEGARSNRGKCRSQAATGAVGLCFSLRLAEAGVTSLRTHLARPDCAGLVGSWQVGRPAAQRSASCAFYCSARARGGCES